MPVIQGTRSSSGHSQGIADYIEEVAGQERSKQAASNENQDRLSVGSSKYGSVVRVE